MLLPELPKQKDKEKKKSQHDGPKVALDFPNPYWWLILLIACFTALRVIGALP